MLIRVFILTLISIQSFAGDTCMFPGEDQVLTAIKQAQQRADQKAGSQQASPTAPRKKAGGLDLESKTEGEINYAIQDYQKYAQKKSQEMPNEEGQLRRGMGNTYRTHASPHYKLGNYGKAIELQDKAGDQFMKSMEFYAKKADSDPKNRGFSLQKVEDLKEDAREAYMNAGKVDKILEYKLLPKKQSQLDEMADELYNQAVNMKKTSPQSRWESFQMLKLAGEACKKTDGFRKYCNPVHIESALRESLPQLQRIMN